MLGVASRRVCTGSSRTALPSFRRRLESSSFHLSRLLVPAECAVGFGGGDNRSMAGPMLRLMEQAAADLPRIYWEIDALEEERLAA